MKHAAAFGMPHALGALVVLGGCAVQAPIDGAPVDDEARLVPVYASVYEAAAVSAGRFGAIPVRVVPNGELEPSSLCPASVSANGQPPAALCVRHRVSGELGWVVVSESLARARPLPKAP